jgi:hypothetical protein
MDSPLGAPGGLGGSLLVQLCTAGAQLALHGFRLNPLFDKGGITMVHTVAGALAGDWQACTA